MSTVRRSSGNSQGRASDTKNRGTRAAELLDSATETLTRKTVQMALNGDATAVRLCLDRIVPIRRQRPIHFEMPALETAADAPKVFASIVAEVAAGNLTLGEAEVIGKLVANFVLALEASDFEGRLLVLEEKKMRRNRQLRLRRLEAISKCKKKLGWVYITVYEGETLQQALERKPIPNLNQYAGRFIVYGAPGRSAKSANSQ